MLLAMHRRVVLQQLTHAHRYCTNVIGSAKCEPFIWVMWVLIVVQSITKGLLYFRHCLRQFVIPEYNAVLFGISALGNSSQTECDVGTTTSCLAFTMSSRGDLSNMPTWLRWRNCDCNTTGSKPLRLLYTMGPVLGRTSTEGDTGYLTSLSGTSSEGTAEWSAGDSFSHSVLLRKSIVCEAGLLASAFDVSSESGVLSMRSPPCSFCRSNSL